MANELSSREPKELSADINVITAQIKWHLNAGINHFITVGELFSHVRDNEMEKEKGGWNAYCDGEIGISRMHANRFIRIFKRFGSVTPELQVNLPKTLTVLDSLVDFTDEELEQTYELPNGETKKPTEMSRREIEELKITKRERDEAIERAEAERKERERLEVENEELRHKEPEYAETESIEPYDRTLDFPYSVQQGNDFYALMNEVDELYKKYANLKDGIDELRGIAKHDEDMQVKYRKASEFWRMLNDIFSSDDRVEVVDASYIEIN